MDKWWYKWDVIGGFHNRKLINSVQYNLETNSNMSIYVNDISTAYDVVEISTVSQFGILYIFYDRIKDVLVKTKATTAICLCLLT